MAGTRNKTLLYGICSIVILITIGAVIYTYNKPRKEGYGGPIKNLRRIPKTTCYQICHQYFNDCMQKNGRVDGSYHNCKTRHNSCIATCTYSDFQRL